MFVGEIIPTLQATRWFPPLSRCRPQSPCHYGGQGSGFSLQEVGCQSTSGDHQACLQSLAQANPQTLQSHRESQPKAYLIMPHLGIGSLQSPLLFAFFALENSFTQMLPNKPKRTCSHLSAPPAGLSPPRHCRPSSPLGTALSPPGDREDWSEASWWCLGLSFCSPFCRGSDSGELPRDTVSSSGSNLSNNFFPWT